MLAQTAKPMDDKLNTQLGPSTGCSFRLWLKKVGVHNDPVMS